MIRSDSAVRLELRRPRGRPCLSVSLQSGITVRLHRMKRVA